MKTSTIINKIHNQYQAGELEFDDMIVALQDACHLAIVKERKSLVKKFSKVYNLDIQEVEKKVLPKRNRHITEEKIKEYSDMFSKQPTIYTKLIHEEEEYLGELKRYGLIYKVKGKSAKVAGYFNKKKRPMFFK